MFTEAGRTKTVTLTQADVAEVSAAVARYQDAKTDLERAAQGGVAELRARLAARREGSR